MNYIYEFAAVAIVTGITGLLSDKLKGGLGRAVNFISCLVLMLCILTPVVSAIKGGVVSGIIPDFEITEEPSDDEEYLQRLKELTEEKLTLTEYMAIKNQFGYEKEEVQITFVGRVTNREYDLQRIEITIRSIGALSRREEIRGYISGKYLCEVLVFEEIK